MIGSNQLVHLEETTVSDEAPPAPRKRRRSPRFRTVFRVARVSARDDQGVARIQNISNEGLLITTSMKLSPGDAIQIDLSDECSLTGLVVWYDRHRCGVRLLRPVNSPALLGRSLIWETPPRDGQSMPIKRLRDNQGTSEVGQLRRSLLAFEAKAADSRPTWQRGANHGAFWISVGCGSSAGRANRSGP
ncbi:MULTISPECIES: PilZ domain-containing protein [unclassified Novosphingobium]|uniref:PilZ domain-containing protein n=1 Tax=unclassified Novosphingobium TaxID=2644732 RepID=UPI0016812204|nr:MULTISPECIES: PilZ domain-containing protein [unclassified Novosphingobium]